MVAGAQQERLGAQRIARRQQRACEAAGVALAEVNVLNGQSINLWLRRELGSHEATSSTEHDHDSRDSSERQLLHHMADNRFSSQLSEELWLPLPVQRARTRGDRQQRGAQRAAFRLRSCLRIGLEENLALSARECSRAPSARSVIETRTRRASAARSIAVATDAPPRRPEPDMSLSVTDPLLLTPASRRCGLHRGVVQREGKAQYRI
eukprot:scaffold122904_cov30-Tisochrysis_lutea.AAC.6